MSFDKLLAERIQLKKNGKIDIVNTTLIIMDAYEISREQAEDLWHKSMSFNKILLSKIDLNGDMDGVEEIIMTKTLAYQNALVCRYKKTNLMIAAARIIQIYVREYLQRKSINKWVTIDLGEVD
jgi:hypothetical protein